MRSGRPLALALTLAACGGAPRPEVVHAPPPPAVASPAPIARGPRKTAPDDGRLATLAATRNHRLGTPNSFAFPKGWGGVLYLRAEGTDPRQALWAAGPGVPGGAKKLLDGATLAADEPLSAAERARRERLRITARGIAQFAVSPAGDRLLVPLGDKLFVLPVRFTEGGPTLGPSVLLPGTGPTLGPSVLLPGTGTDASSRGSAPSPAAPTDASFTPDGAYVAYVRDGNLYRARADGAGKEEALTTGGTELSPLATAEFVAQEEFGRSRGYWFSPDGTRVLYETVDNRGTERLALVDPAHPEREPERPAYPRAGRANAVIGFVALDLATKRRVTIPFPAKEFPYVATVSWLGEGASAQAVLYALERPQQRGVLFRIDGGATPTLTRLEEDRDPAFLEAEGELHAVRGGYVRARGGRVAEKVTETYSTDPRATVVRRGAAPRDLFVDGAGGLHLHRLLGVEDGGAALAIVGADGFDGKLARLSEGGVEVLAAEPDGAVNAWVSPEGDRAVIARFAPGKAPTWSLRPLRCAKDRCPETPLPTAVILPEVLPTPRIVRTDEAVIAIVAPSTPPAPGERRPIVDAAYGGPGVNIATANPLGYARAQWLADRLDAYVVTVDAAGTPNRGLDHERRIAGAFATVPLEGHVRALEALKRELPDADFSKIGVVGWSFGGFFSALAALDRPDVFKVAVAGAAPADWRDYDTAYTERYLGVPKGPGDEPEAYARANLVRRAACHGRTPAAADPSCAPRGAAAPLLVIHGTADDNVYFAHSLALTQALAEAGVPARFHPVAGSTHLLADPKDMIRVWGHIADFLDEGLRRGTTAPSDAKPPAP